MEGAPPELQPYPAVTAAAMAKWDALIALTAIIDSWWMLGPVMAFDFVVTAAVLAIIVRLLSD